MELETHPISETDIQPFAGSINAIVEVVHLLDLKKSYGILMNTTLSLSSWYCVLSSTGSSQTSFFLLDDPVSGMISTVDVSLNSEGSLFPIL